MVTASRPLRADAARNREKLLAAATALFAERGLDVPMEHIARKAEVSIGTLYKHFPTREDLVTAIFPERLAALDVIGEKALADPDPWHAFATYLDDIGSYFSNDACGGLCAVNEHNASHPLRPLHMDRSLPGRRPDAVASWYRQMYVCHVLDHPYRMAPRERGAMTLEDHWKFMAALS